MNPKQTETLSKMLSEFSDPDAAGLFEILFKQKLRSSEGSLTKAEIAQIKMNYDSFQPDIGKAAKNSVIVNDYLNNYWLDFGTVNKEELDEETTRAPRNTKAEKGRTNKPNKISHFNLNHLRHDQTQITPKY